MTTAAWVLAAIFTVMLALVISLLADRKKEAPVLSAAARDLMDETEEEYALPMDMREDEPVNKFGLGKNDEVELTGLIPHLLGENEEGGNDELLSEVPQEEEEEAPVFDLSDFKLEDPDLQRQADTLKREVSVIWPQGDVMMKQTQVSSGILYEWQGLAVKERSFLFDVCSNAACAAMIDVSSGISDDNAVPSENFAFLLHADAQRADMDSQAAAMYLSKEGKKPAIVIAEDNEADLIEIAGMKLVKVSVGSCAKAVLQSSSKDMKGMIAVAEKQLRPQKNITSDALMEIISLGVRLKQHLPAGRNAAAEAIMQKYPQLDQYLSARITYDEKTGLITVRACDDQSIEDVIGALRYNDSSLRLLSRRSACVCADTESDAFGKAEDALVSLYGVDDILPVLTDRPSNWNGIQCAGVCFKDRKTSSQLVSSMIL